MAKAGGNPKNLKPPFKKGEVANPRGRPKGSQNRQTVIRDVLGCLFDGKNPFTKETGKYSVAERMIFRQAINAIKDGDLKAVEFLFDGAYGKVTDSAKITLDAEVKTEEHRPRTRAEIREHLKGKGFDVDTRTFIK